MDILDSKPCSKCKQNLPLAEFSKRQASKDGLSYICRQCSAVKQKNTYVPKNAKGVVGKVCSRCKKDLPLTAFGIAKLGLLGVRSECRDCVRETRKSNPEPERERRRESYRRHRDKRLRYGRAYYHKNKGLRPAKPKKPRVVLTPEERKAAREETLARYRERHRERLNAESRARYASMPDVISGHKNKWRVSNPHKQLAISHRRLCKLRQNGGSFTGDEWAAKLELYKGRCHWCAKKIRGTPEADHVIPVAKGGTSDISNIVPSCGPCNRRKNAKMPWEFAGRLF